MLRQMVIGVSVSVLALAFLPHLLVGNMLVLGVGIAVLVGIILIMVS